MQKHELEQAFATAVYSAQTPAGSVRFRIGGRVEGLADTPFALITAYNPAGSLRAPAENRAANARLRGELDALEATIRPAFSHDGAGGHRELQFAVFGVTRDAVLALARELGQAAFVWFGGDVAELVWVDEASPPGAP